MAEYYDMQEAMDKLRKSEEEVQELVKQGQLRQYMDAGKAVFKTEDIDALAEEIVGLDISSIGLPSESSELDLELEGTAGLELEPETFEDTPQPSEETEIQLEATAAAGNEVQLEPDDEGAKEPGPDDMELNLEPDTPKDSEGGFGLSQMGDLTSADTNVGTIGINILSGTGDAYQLTEDTRAETSAGDEIDELDSLDADASLESLGSGSGLLDLSLQADDTSLGAVLDDILPAGAEGGDAGGGDLPVEEIGLTDEAEDLLGGGDAVEAPQAAEAGEDLTAPMGVAEPAPVMPGAPQMVAVAPVDPKSTVFGVMMFMPMVALIAAAIVLAAAVQGVVPSILKSLIEIEIADSVALIWVVVGGLTVLSLLILAFAAVSGTSGGTKAKRAPKAKKAKKEKKPKAKKEKKAKKAKKK